MNCTRESFHANKDCHEVRAEEFRTEMLSLNSEFASLSNEAKALESEIEKNLKELFGVE